MSTVQIPFASGETLTLNAYELDGTAIKTGVATTEVAPTRYSGTFATIPNGEIVVVAFRGGVDVYSDVFAINDGNAINLGSAERSAILPAVGETITYTNQILGKTANVEMTR